jgi:hypothetical protein
MGNAVGPRLTAGKGGILLLSWMERSDAGATLKVSELRAEGWQPARKVVTDPRMFVNWADLPSVTAVAGDHWAAHWLSNSGDRAYSYDIRLAQSFDAGQSWTGIMTPHTDGTPTEHGFVSVYPSGDAVGLVWLDGRKTANDVEPDPTSSGMTLRAAHVLNNGQLDREQEIDDLVCDCCPTNVVVSSGGPIAVYRDRSTDNIRDIRIARYKNGEWQPSTPVASDNWVVSGCPVNGPAVAASGELVAVAWFTAEGQMPRVEVALSKDGGNTFAEPLVVDDDAPAGHADIAYIGESAFAVSWMGKAENDYPVQLRSITAAGELGDVHTVGESALARSIPQMGAKEGELIFAWSAADSDDSRIDSVSVAVQRTTR